MFQVTHSGKSLLQFTMWDIAITIHVHLFEGSHQLSFLDFLLTLKNLTEVIKVQFGCSWGPVFIESCLGWISTSKLESCIVEMGNNGESTSSKGWWQPTDVVQGLLVFSVLIDFLTYLFKCLVHSFRGQVCIWYF